MIADFDYNIMKCYIIYRITELSNEYSNNTPVRRTSDRHQAVVVGQTTYHENTKLT